MDCVMASPISSPMACCSRSSSLHICQPAFHSLLGRRRRRSHIHSLVNLIDGEAAVYIFHCLAGILHGLQRFFVDIGRLYAVDFALQSHNLPLSLFKSMFKLLLTSQCGLCSCEVFTKSASSFNTKATIPIFVDSQAPDADFPHARNLPDLPTHFIKQAAT
jgi:hypothetical protein